MMELEHTYLGLVHSAILYDRDVAEALNLFSEEFASGDYPQFETLLQTISSNYDLMKDYMRRGFQDPMRNQLYTDMLHQLYSLYFDVALDEEIYITGYYQLAAQHAKQIDLGDGAWVDDLERYVQDVAMLSLETSEEKPSATRQLRHAHEQQLAKIFDAIIVSPFWNESICAQMKRLFSSPLIDVYDAQTLVSAVMLSGLNRIDPSRFILLWEVWQQADDDELRQRALVGWRLMLTHKDFHRIESCDAHFMAALKGAEGEKLKALLLSIDEQLIYCSNARNDMQTIQRDILPDMMKRAKTDLLHDNIFPHDEADINDILYPDKAEKDMERMEQHMKELADMQQQGMDVYFGGFAQMKRFPFFATLSNWFVPFSPSNAALDEPLETLGQQGFIASLFQTGPFCDSDKYSFLFAVQRIYSQMPPQLRDMMRHAKVAIDEEHLPKDLSAFRRRQYLQSLYRFFALNDWRTAFRNPMPDLDDQYNHNLAFLTDYFHIGNALQEAVTLIALAERHAHWPMAYALFEHYKVPFYRWDGILPDKLDSMLTYLRLRIRFERYEKAHGEQSCFWEDLGTHASQLIYLSALSNPESGLRYEELFDRTNPPTSVSMQVERNVRFTSDVDLRRCAAAYYCNHQWEAAALAYRELLRRDERTEYKIYLGLALTQQRLFDEALKLLYPLYFDTPSLPVTRAIAWILLNQTQLERADRLYDELFAQHELVADDYLNAAYAKWFLRKMDSAIRLLVQWQKHKLKPAGGAAPENGAQHDRPGKLRGMLMDAFKQDWSTLKANGISKIELRLMADLAANALLLS